MVHLKQKQDGARATMDFDHLDRQTQGDQDLQVEVLQLFFGQIDHLMAALQSAPDDRVWYEYAHAIKGSARGVGLMQLGDLAEAAERMMGTSEELRRKAHLEEMRYSIGEARAATEARFPVFTGNNRDNV